jgi:glycosyltransferase involved in cell wall biosynthesis
VDEAVRALPDGVRAAVTGSVPAYDVPRYLAGMDVAVAPYLPSSHFYFSPLKVAEAMAASLPVVASDFPPVRDLLGDTGLLVPAGDVDALASALFQLAMEPDTRARLAREGRARAVGSLDWLAVARRTIDVSTGTAERHEVSA